MWVRDIATGSSEFVIDPRLAVGMVKSGSVEAIDRMPDVEPLVEEPPAKGRRKK